MCRLNLPKGHLEISTGDLEQRGKRWSLGLLNICVYICICMLYTYTLCQERGSRNFARSSAAGYSRPAEYSRVQPNTADHSRPAEHSRGQPSTAEQRSTALAYALDASRSTSFTRSVTCASCRPSTSYTCANLLLRLTFFNLLCSYASTSFTRTSTCV